MKKHLKLSNAFLCVMSLYFYAYGEPKLVALMIASIIFNYCIALLIDKLSRYRNVCLIVSVILNIGILFVCKYLGWSIEILNSIFDKKIPAFNMALPIGISFYTFQAMSYVIDVWKRVVPAQKNIINVGLYVSLFPQLVAGPIVRYTDIEKQIYKRSLSPEKWGSGIERFIIGFSKKVLLADSFSVIADKAFLLNSENSLGILFSWIGAIAYSLQIYYDFSGYSDMAIGLGKMLGFSFLENFNYPYMASSITDFWRRWHISLSQWFRDYVYIPLGGNRHGTKRMLVALGITWLSTGIWHGANVTFLLWGCIYGTLIILEKLYEIPQKIQAGAAWKIPYRLFVLIVIMLCWVIFRAENINFAIQYIATMFGISGMTENSGLEILYCLEFKWELLAGSALCFPVIPWLKSQLKEHASYVLLFLEFLLFMVSISYLIKGTYSPFIYFNF